MIIKNTQDSGFTMIELLIVLAIAGLVIGIGVPSFQNTIESNRIANSTNDLVHTLNYARLEAIRRGGSVTIESANESKTWSGGVNVNVGDELIRTLAATDTDISISAATNTSLTFRANGFVNNNGETFNVCPSAGGDGRQIAIAISGRISINSDYTCE